MFQETEGALEREKSPKASSSKMEEEGKKGKEGEGANSKGRKKKKAEKKCEPTCSAEVRRWKQVSERLRDSAMSLFREFLYQCSRNAGLLHDAD